MMSALLFALGLLVLASLYLWIMTVWGVVVYRRYETALRKRPPAPVRPSFLIAHSNKGATDEGFREAVERTHAVTAGLPAKARWLLIGISFSMALTLALLLLGLLAGGGMDLFVVTGFMLFVLVCLALPGALVFRFFTKTIGLLYEHRSELRVLRP